MIEYLPFFDKQPETFPLYEAVREMICAAFDNVTVKVQKSQIVFAGRRNFACVWLPPRKIKGRPEVYIILTFGLGDRLEHPRFVESVEPHPGRWTHHVIIQSTEEVDAQIQEWLREAYDFANNK